MIKQGGADRLPRAVLATIHQHAKTRELRGYEMSTRQFNSFADLGAALARMAVEQRIVLAEAVGTASTIVEHNVKKTFGDKERLPELAEATQAERTRLGWTPDDPLLRDGSLLRASVEREHHGLEAGVGSAEPVMAISEKGFVNSRSGKSVPPRPVFRIGLGDSTAEISAVVGESVQVLINERTTPRSTP